LQLIGRTFESVLLATQQGESFFVDAHLFLE